MRVFRLSKSRFADDLSGKGAEIAGGRWNSKGMAMLYTGASRALCTAEIAVHVPLGIVPFDYWMIAIEIPDDSIFELETGKLPKKWRDFPHQTSTQNIGNEFLKENKFLVFKAPSAVVQGDFNYLINPFHPDFSKVKIVNKEPFSFDNRLFIK
jgi:RES domain-containing protein